MKRASYREAVRWIADNDDAVETDLGVVSVQISVLLIADIFDVDPVKVAKNVLKLRENITS